MDASIHDLFKRIGIPPQPPETLRPLLEDRRVTDDEFIKASFYMYLHPTEWRVWFTDPRQLNGQRTPAERDWLYNQMRAAMLPFIRGPVDMGRVTWHP